MGKHFRVLMLVGAQLFSGVAIASAQIPGLDVHLGARAGWFAPAGKLGEDVSGRESKIGQGFAFGASLEFDIPASPINVRATFDATMGRPIEVDGVEVPGTDVDMMVFTGDLVFRPIPRVLAQPYLLAGAGIKRYSAEGSFGDDTRLTGHLGLGLDLSLGPLSVMGEVSDYISTLEVTSGDSELQNDLFITVGFRIGIL